MVEKDGEFAHWDVRASEFFMDLEAEEWTKWGLVAAQTLDVKEWKILSRQIGYVTAELHHRWCKKSPKRFQDGQENLRNLLWFSDGKVLNYACRLVWK